MEPEIKQYSAVVIGGANMDICGSPSGKLIAEDSNPGAVSVRPGGVGRNIAHNLCLLGLDVSLITALGGDIFSAGLLESCRALGMDMRMARSLPERRSSTYLYVTDESGDMHVGISDMDIVESVSPEWISQHIARINRADAVVIDANLTEASIAYLAANCTAPMIADPVSTVKALRLKSILPRLRAIKPNALEAAALTGEQEPERAAKALLRAGVKQVYVSLGPDGILAAQGESLIRLPCENRPVVNTTGAGDAATAAIVWAGVHGLDLASTAAAALRAGAITAACPDTNSPGLCLDRD